MLRHGYSVTFIFIGFTLLGLVGPAGRLAGGASGLSRTP
jgi:hypothetical protein